MEEITKQGKKSKVWVWVIVVVVLLLLFFMFKGANKGKSAGEKASGTGTPLIEAGDIDSLDVGANPDIGVDDVNSLPSSQETISS